MNSYSVIVQGEGKGHLSQALVLARQLAQRGVPLQRVYLGRSLFRRPVSYARADFQVPVTTFLSPDFMQSSDRKGILVFSSILLNTFLIPVYLFETCRIGIRMRLDRTDRLVNFYDPVGALAAWWWKRKAGRLVISHHFYLSHSGFLHPHGWDSSWFWLQLLNRIMMASSTRVIALSFRKDHAYKKITLRPPLIDDRILGEKHIPGERDLCYFKHPGFVSEILDYYRDHPEEQADIFTGAVPHRPLPENVRIHRPSREAFIQKMLRCRRVLTTAGFDTVAEACYLGIPVYVIPSAHHYEQYCNALDAARTGMVFHLDGIDDLEDVEFKPLNNKKYKDWVEDFDPLKMVDT